MESKKNTHSKFNWFENAWARFEKDTERSFKSGEPIPYLGVGGNILGIYVFYLSLASLTYSINIYLFALREKMILSPRKIWAAKSVT